MLKSDSKPTWKDAGGSSGLGGAPPPLPTNRAKGDIYPSRDRGRGKSNRGRGGGPSLTSGRGGIRGRAAQRGKQRHPGQNPSNENNRQDTPALYNGSGVSGNETSPPSYEEIVSEKAKFEEAVSEKANVEADAGLHNTSVPSNNNSTGSIRMPFSLTQSAAFRDGELNKSYDFAKDDVGNSRELTQVNEEEEIESEEELDAHKYFEELISKDEELNSKNETTASTIVARESKMDDFTPLSIFTWVGRKQGVRNLEKSLKLTLKDAKTIFPPGTLYSIGEDYDTYQRGGLYPLFHISEDSGTIDKIQESDTQIDPEEMGSQYMVDQGVFEEVARVTPSMAGSSNIELALAVTSYKSMERDLSPKLIKEWKSWTGSRAFIQDLEENGLDCHAVRFFVKKAPIIDPHEDNDCFSYVLITEVILRSPRDKIALIDAMQRFRVERWFGYQTVYVKNQ